MHSLKRIISTLLLTNFTSACIVPSFAASGIDVIGRNSHSTNFEPIEFPLNNSRYQQLKQQEEVDLQKAISKSMKSYDYEYALSLAPGESHAEKINIQQALLNDIKTVQTLEDRQLSLALEASLRSYSQEQEASSFGNDDLDLQQAIKASEESYVKELAKEIAQQYSLYEQIAQTSADASVAQTQNLSLPQAEEAEAVVENEKSLPAIQQTAEVEAVVEDEKSLPAIPQAEEAEAVVEDEKPLPAIPQAAEIEAVVEDGKPLPAIPKAVETEAVIEDEQPLPAIQQATEAEAVVEDGKPLPAIQQAAEIEAVVEDEQPLPAIPQAAEGEAVVEDGKPLPAIQQATEAEAVVEEKPLPAIQQEEKTGKEGNLLSALVNKINAPFQEKANTQQRQASIIEALQQNEKFFNITSQEMEEITHMIASGNQQLLTWLDTELNQAEDYDPDWEENDNSYEKGAFLKAMHNKLASLEIADQAKARAPKNVGRININRNARTLFEAVRALNADQEDEQTSTVEEEMTLQDTLVPVGPLMPPPPAPAPTSQIETISAEKEEINDALRNHLAKRRSAILSNEG